MSTPVRRRRRKPESSLAASSEPIIDGPAPGGHNLPTATELPAPVSSNASSGPRSILPYVWMVIGSLCFAIMSQLAHAAGRTCDWQVIAMARSGLALVFAAGLVFGGRRKFVFFRPATLWMRSCAGSVSLLCGFYALTKMPVADVLTLSNMYPLWVAVLSWPLLGVIPRGGVWAAVACGLCGVVLLEQPKFAAGDYVWMIAVFASFTSAIALIGLHKLHGLDARAIVVHFSAVSLLFCFGAFLLLPHSTSVFSKFDALTLLTLVGVGATATGGQILLTKAFAEGDPAKVSVVGLSQVGFAMLFDIALWGRAFNSTTIFGTLLVLLPTAWIMLRRQPKPAGRFR